MATNKNSVIYMLSTSKNRIINRVDNNINEVDDILATNLINTKIAKI